MGASSVSAVRRDSKSPDALSTLPVGRYVVGRSGPMRLSPFPPRTARSCLKLWHRRARAPIGWAAPVSTSRPLCLRLFPPRFGSPLLGRSPPLARLPSQVPGTGPLAPGGLAYEKPPDPAGYVPYRERASPGAVMSARCSGTRPCRPALPRRCGSACVVATRTSCCRTRHTPTPGATTSPARSRSNARR